METKSLFDRVSSFIAHPFTGEDMDLVEWIAFTVFTVMIGFFTWHTIKEFYE